MPTKDWNSYSSERGIPCSCEPNSRNSHPSVIKQRAGNRIKRERNPKTNQDHHQCHDLSSHARKSKHEKEYVSQSDLGESVFERPVGLRRMQRPEEDSEKDQDQRAPGRMSNHLAEGLTLRFPACDREGKRCANQKRECRLNQVMQRTSLPIYVLGVVGDECPYGAVRKCIGPLRASACVPRALGS